MRNRITSRSVFVLVLTLLAVAVRLPVRAATTPYSIRHATLSAVSAIRKGVAAGFQNYLLHGLFAGYRYEWHPNAVA